MSNYPVVATNIGNVIPRKLPGTPIQEVCRVDLRGNGVKCNMPRCYTAHLGMIAHDESSNVLSTRDIIAQAIVKYGSGGDQEVIRIDWRTGTRLTVPGSYLSISVDYRNDIPFSSTDPNRAPFTLDNDVPVTFSANIAEGSVSQTGVQSTASLTQFVYDLGAGAVTPCIPIPAKAYQVILMADSRDFYAALEGEFQYRDPAGARPVGQWLASATAATVGLPIPIPQGARFSRIRNRGASAFGIVAIIWSISV